MLTRRFIATRALPGIAAAAVLAGCTSTTTNGVTTITLNVARMNAWGQAIVNGAEMVAGLAGFAGTPAALAIAAIGPVVSADMTAFNTAANGQINLTFDSTSVPPSITSVLNDGQMLLTDVTAAVSQIPAAVASTAQTYINAIKTIVSVFQALVNPAVAAAAALPMTEAQALTTLNVVH